VPVSKTDAQSGSLKGRYKALRLSFRAWKRDREVRRAEVDAIEADELRDRITEFWDHVENPYSLTDLNLKQLRKAHSKEARHKYNKTRARMKHTPQRPD
jgi:hypothetical protein